MRIFSSLLVLIWLVSGWWYYNNYKDCCDANQSNPKIENPKDIKSDIDDVKSPDLSIANDFSKSPILFNASSDKSILGPSWLTYRDSLAGNLGKDRLLEIVGLYKNDEINNTSYPNLGIARANNISELFKDLVPKEKMKLVGRLDDGSISDLKGSFVSSTFRSLVYTSTIKEIDDHTLIYFPFNSTKRLKNADIDQYLTDVAKSVSENNQRIRLIGHTDNVGSVYVNEKLGFDRALDIKNILVKKGVVPSRIMVESRGEKSPIASNETKEGRAQNRRLELKIIK